MRKYFLADFFKPDGQWRHREILFRSEAVILICPIFLSKSVQLWQAEIRVLHRVLIDFAQHPVSSGYYGPLKNRINIL